MPEVIVKLTRPSIVPWQKRRLFGELLQAVVATVLTVPGTQAELKSDEVEVDFEDFSPWAITNGFDCAITVKANLYPERAGREQEFSDAIATGVKPLFTPSHPELLCYVWVLLTPGGFTKFST